MSVDQPEELHFNIDQQMVFDRLPLTALQRAALVRILDASKSQKAQRDENNSSCNQFDFERPDSVSEDC
jgi:hypothetical protein